MIYRVAFLFAGKVFKDVPGYVVLLLLSAFSYSCPYREVSSRSPK